MKTTPFKLFFSREVDPDRSPLLHFCKQHGWELTARSLLRFEALPFTVPAAYDAVFFSSSRSVDFFLQQVALPPGTAIACIGEGTTEHLRSTYGLTPDFTGEHSGHPEEVAADFKQWLGNRRVLFPLAKRSNETVARVIPDSQKIVVRCYETVLAGERIPEQDLYVFSSPTNIDAFLEHNVFPKDPRIIAWGKTTDKKIVELFYTSVFVLADSTEKALVDYIEEQFLLKHYNVNR